MTLILPLADLTLLPPPETDAAEVDADDDTLIDFTGVGFKAATPPAGFSDAHNVSTESGDSLPPGVNDLPPSIREKIDSMIANDEELGTQLAAIDALLIGEYANDEELGTQLAAIDALLIGEHSG